MGTLRLGEGMDTRTLIAGGTLTVRDASALQGLLEKAFESVRVLLIDLSGAQSLDFACAEVLCSANSAFRAAHKTLSITGIVPESIRQSLNDMDIGPANCDREPSDHCLWNMKGWNDQESPGR